MLNQLFNDVFTSTAVKPLTMLEAIGVALVLGLVVAKTFVAERKKLGYPLLDEATRAQLLAEEE